MRMLLILLILGISNVVFGQNIPTQSAYKGGQGSGYAKATLKVSIGFNGEVDRGFAKPISNVLGSNNQILFTDSLQNYTIKAVSSNGKEFKVVTKGNSISFLADLKPGYYWISISNLNRKETYKVVKP